MFKPGRETQSRAATQSARRLAMARAGTIACCLLGAVQSRADDLYLRGNNSKIIGATIEMNEGGVLYRPARGEQSFYSWDQVRELQSDAPLYNDRFAEYRELAEDLWRARSRVERLDYELAEPLLDKHFDGMIGRTDPTALVVAEGLLRCRIARRARAEAIVPWLETWRMRAAGVEASAYSEMPRVLDQNSGLCPTLPPVWVREEANLPALVHDLSIYKAPDNDIVQSVADLYEYAARKALEKARKALPLDTTENDRAASSETAAPSGQLDEIGSRQDSNGGSTSILLVRAFLQATLPDVDSEERDRAARALGRWTRSAEWAGAWSHYARGIARISSPVEEDRRRGLVDLLLLPSEYVEVDSYLAGLALYRAIAVVESFGLHDAAESLRHEFDLRFSDHPINPRVSPSFGGSNARSGDGANQSESS